MSRRSIAGKLAWQERALTFGPELRERIERESAARFERWKERGRLPAWLRIKRAVRARWQAITGRASAVT